VSDDLVVFYVLVFLCGCIFVAAWQAYLKGGSEGYAQGFAEGSLRHVPKPAEPPPPAPPPPPLSTWHHSPDHLCEDCAYLLERVARLREFWDAQWDLILHEEDDRLSPAYHAMLGRWRAAVDAVRVMDGKEPLYAAARSSLADAETT